MKNFLRKSEDFYAKVTAFPSSFCCLFS